MKKKVKLFTTIASLCLAVALMAFGVYAATSVGLTINSKVSFVVTDVFVDITGNTSWKGAKPTEDYVDYTYSSYTKNDTNYTPKTGTIAEIWNAPDIAFTSAKDEVVYTLTIKNVSSENKINVKVNNPDKILEPTGTTVVTAVTNDSTGVGAIAATTNDNWDVLATKTLEIKVTVTLVNKANKIEDNDGKVLDGLSLTIIQAA